MILNTEENREVLENEEEARKYFLIFAKDNLNKMCENEFNKWLEIYLEENGKSELSENFKKDNLFSLYTPENQNFMLIEDFVNAFRDISVIAKSNDGAGDFDFDFKFEETDLDMVIDDHELNYKHHY